MKKTIYTLDRQTQSARLIEAREAAGFTQMQVHEVLGIAQSELSKIEKGQRKVESLTLRKLAELYGKSVSFFFQETEVFTEQPGYPASLESASVKESVQLYLSPQDEQSASIRQQIKARRGVEDFRKALLARYKNTCVITGCKIISLLEAAVIKPLGDADHYHAANGLLLRADIHTLFDLDVIGIDPDTLTVHVKKEAKRDGYEGLDGMVIGGGKAGNSLDKGS